MPKVNPDDWVVKLPPAYYGKWALYATGCGFADPERGLKSLVARLGDAAHDGKRVDIQISGAAKPEPTAKAEVDPGPRPPWTVVFDRKTAEKWALYAQQAGYSTPGRALSATVAKLGNAAVKCCRAYIAFGEATTEGES